MKFRTKFLPLVLLAAAAHASDTAPLAIPAPVPPIKVPQFFLGDAAQEAGTPDAMGPARRVAPFSAPAPAVPPAVPAAAGSGAVESPRTFGQMPMTSGKPTDLQMPMVEPAPGLDYKLLIARSGSRKPSEGVAQAFRLPATRDPR